MVVEVKYLVVWQEIPIIMKHSYVISNDTQIPTDYNYKKTRTTAAIGAAGAENGAGG